MPVQDYEARQEAKRERYEERAERARHRATAAFDRADLSEEKSDIPFGQPILVGHHSERRHRRALERADNAMRRGIEETEKANHYAAKAAGVGTGGISSDDPAAVEKLSAKLAKAEANQEFMRAVNKIIKPAYRKGVRADGPADEIEALTQRIVVATGEAIGDGATRALLKPDFANRVGFADYQLSNNNANIRRMRDRIASLERASEAEHVETDYQGIVRVVENPDENRVQLFFPGKPADDVRKMLKSSGFRWSRMNGAWQRHLNNAGRRAANYVVKQLTE